MKVFPVQKTQTNTYSPQILQNDTLNQNFIMKSNFTEDKFTSKKVSFGTSINDLEAGLAELLKRKNRGELTEKAYLESKMVLEKELDDLKRFFRMDEYAPRWEPPDTDLSNGS